MASSSGPKSETVARTGTPGPMPPSERYSAGKPAGSNASPSSFIRFSAGPPPAPGAATPERSPFTSDTTTGTPAAASCSAMTCRVTVFPVPVAPAIRPWRLSIRSGTRTPASATTASSWIPLPSSSAVPSKA